MSLLLVMLSDLTQRLSSSAVSIVPLAVSTVPLALSILLLTPVSR